MPTMPSFLLVTCQVGAEGALKGEIARRWPAFRLSYSRPGFVTFKLPADAPLGDEFSLDCVFARAWAFSFGKVKGDDAARMAEEAWRVAIESERLFDAVHAWERDRFTPGFKHFEPGPTPLADEVHAAVIAARPDGGATARSKDGAAPRDATVFDCVIVEPGEWWLGWHVARSHESRLPGGMQKTELPAHAVSRAYLKMQEALNWSRLPLRAGDTCLELGCSPGGAAQALLDRGAKVIGVDPATVKPIVTEHPNFRHLRRRGKEVPRSELRDVRFLFADMNVAPNYTLDTVEALVTHEKVHVEGLILTLKLIEWELADNLEAWLDRIRGWGYYDIDARQLQHNRQEICVAALRRPTTQKRLARAVRLTRTVKTPRSASRPSAASKESIKHEDTEARRNAKGKSKGDDRRGDA
jgi:23S rRNA (cytidine2498-2'-O)-methyltransferase